jgi:hypothetical protein
MQRYCHQFDRLPTMQRYSNPTGMVALSFCAPLDVVGTEIFPSFI